MDDLMIIELYFARDEQAIKETDADGERADRTGRSRLVIIVGNTLSPILK